MEPIAFTFDGGTTFGSVNATGKAVPARLFKLGDYPEKGFSLTEAEADAQIAEFQRVPILVNHRLSDFNKPDLFGIGALESITRHGDEIYGTMTFSAAAAHLLKGAERKLSMGFTRAKKPGEVSLVLDPHVDVAAVLHAFGDLEELPHEKAPEKPVPERRSGEPMSIIAAIKEKLGFSDAQVSELRAEFSNGAEVEALKTRLAAAETKTTALETENASLKTSVTSLGTGVGATFAKTQGETLAAKYLAERKIDKDEVAETAAAFESAYAGATFGAEEPAGVKALKAMLDKRQPLPDPTAHHFGGAEDPSGRTAPAAKTEPFDAVANFNKAPESK